MADAMTVDRLVRFLAGRGHEVDLLCFVEDAAQESALRAGLGGVCRRLSTVRRPRWRSYVETARSLPSRLPMQAAYFLSAAMKARVEQLVAGGGYDIVYTHLIRMSEYTRRLPLPKVLGMQISQALNLSRMVDHAADPFRRLFYRIETAKVRPYEATVAADYDRVFLCGPSDVAAIERTAPLPNVEIRPHGQDVPPLERVRAARREPGAVVITGAMGTYTNVDAVTWFATEAFPRIEAAVPEASLWIVGRSPPRAVRALARPPRVVVTGEVPDVYAWLCRAEVAVAPMRIGAGMQNKVVQAMASELPVVATRVANEGIGATPEEQILIRDDPEAQAAEVVRLLRDPERRQQLGRAGRAFVEAHWTWEAHFEKLERVLVEVAREHSLSR
jgi:glycosyltransferase involved in cell wall biosynthesis